MTDKEAAHAFKNGASDWNEIYEAIRLAIPAVRKQIPKPLIDVKKSADGVKGICRICGLRITLFDDVNYCCRCGNAIEKEK